MTPAGGGAGGDPAGAFERAEAAFAGHRPAPGESREAWELRGYVLLRDYERAAWALLDDLGRRGPVTTRRGRYERAAGMRLRRVEFVGPRAPAEHDRDDDLMHTGKRIQTTRR